MWCHVCGPVLVGLGGQSGTWKGLSTRTLTFPCQYLSTIGPNSYFLFMYHLRWGTRWRSWWMHCATSRKVAGSVPDRVIGIFHWHNPSGRTMALGSTSPLTEIIFSPNGSTAPWGPRPPHYRGFTITLRHTTLGRTPLDEWSARRRDLYLTTHNTTDRHPCPRRDSNPQSQRP
jgi:hypothetical protein